MLFYLISIKADWGQQLNELLHFLREKLLTAALVYSVYKMQYSYDYG